MRPTLKEIANIAQVSITTVSLVLNEKGNISEETRARVKRAIAEAGYKRAPSRRVIGILGMPTPDLNFSLRQAAAEYGYDLEHVEDGEALRRGRRFPPIAGLIVYGGQWEPPVLEQVGRAYPTVLLGGRARHAAVDTIWVDNAHGIELAVGYLLDRGHRSIALLNGPPDTPTSWDKKVGFERALAMAPEPARGTVVDCASFLPQDARDAALQLLSTFPGITGLIIGESIIAKPVCDVLREHGVAVPSDLSLIVFRDDPRLAAADPPLTAIGLPALDIARETFAQLVCRINDPGARERRVLFKPYIVERKSVAPVG